MEELMSSGREREVLGGRQEDGRQCQVWTHTHTQTEISKHKIFCDEWDERVLCKNAIVK